MGERDRSGVIAQEGSWGRSSRGRQGDNASTAIVARVHLTMCNCTHIFGDMTTPVAIDLCYALAARKSDRYLSRLYDSHLAPTGLSVSQFAILGSLAHGPLKIADLADRLIMERTSLVRALKPLQSSGWVAVKRSDNDRAFDIALSPAGVDKLAEAIPLWTEAQAAFEDKVGRARAIKFRNQIQALNLGG